MKPHTAVREPPLLPGSRESPTNQLKTQPVRRPFTSTSDMSSKKMPSHNSRNLPTLPGDRPPSRGAQVSRPHFRPIRPIVDSPHEQAVIDAGYPWVRTNPLIPTWMSPGADPRSNPSAIPDQLRWHGHHGVNTHLIVEGDLTLMKPKKMFGQNHVAAVTLSTDLGTPKELSVAPEEIYMGTTQQACKFVEGHRCLSPTSAHRYMCRGSLEWVDKAGQAVRGGDRVYVLEQLEKADFETNFDFKAMQRVATCSFTDDNQVTRSMRQWFLREWNDPDVQAAKGDLRPAIHPSESSFAAQRQDHEMDIVDDEADSGDELELDDEDGSTRDLLNAFREWLGMTEN